METIHTNQMLVYGYIDEDTRKILYKTFYGENTDEFGRALDRCRQVKKVREWQFLKTEIVCYLTTKLTIE